MLEAFLADILQQLLQLWNLGHACSAEGLEWVVSEAPGARVAANDAVAVIGGVASIGHGASLDLPDAGAECIFLAHRSGDDLLVIHAHVLEEVFGQVGAMEARSE